MSSSFDFAIFVYFLHNKVPQPYRAFPCRNHAIEHRQFDTYDQMQFSSETIIVYNCVLTDQWELSNVILNLRVTVNIFTNVMVFSSVMHYWCFVFQVKSDKKCDAALRDKCEEIVTKLDG
jgi:hypothetical protein